MLQKVKDLYLVKDVKLFCFHYSCSQCRLSFISIENILLNIMSAMFQISESETLRQTWVFV